MSPVIVVRRTAAAYAPGSTEERASSASRRRDGPNSAPAKTPIASRGRSPRGSRTPRSPSSTMRIPVTGSTTYAGFASCASSVLIPSRTDRSAPVPFVPARTTRSTSRSRPRPRSPKRRGPASTTGRCSPAPPCRIDRKGGIQDRTVARGCGAVAYAVRLCVRPAHVVRCCSVPSLFSRRACRRDRRRTARARPPRVRPKRPARRNRLPRALGR